MSIRDLVFERKRTLGEIVLEYGSTNSDRWLERAARSRGASTPGRWAPTASSPGRPSERPTRGSRPTSSRSFTHNPAEDQPRGARSGKTSRADSLGPPQGLSSRPAGRRVPDPLVADSRPAALGGRPGSARGAQAGRNTRGDRLHRGDDAGRIDYGRLRPQNLWALRMAIGEALSQSPPGPKIQAGRLSHPPPRPRAFAGPRSYQEFHDSCRAPSNGVTPCP